MDLYNAKMMGAAATANAKHEVEVAEGKVNTLTNKWKEMEEEKHLPSQDWIDLQAELDAAKRDLDIKTAFYHGALNINLVLQDCR